MIADFVRKEERFVYTNLPLRWKAFRAYIYLKARQRDIPRWKAKLLSTLVRPVSKDHFQRFVERLDWIDNRKGELLAACGSTSIAEAGTFRERECIAQAREDACKPDCRNPFCSEWCDEQGRGLGPEVITGEGANWIPPKSVIFLDELHKWYGNGHVERCPREILSYCTMHRHLFHRVYCLTQRAGNVAKPFRDMAEEYIKITNLAKTKMLGFLRWPFTMFRQSRFYREDILGDEIRPGAKALDCRLVIPAFGAKVFFRLYDSHSHVYTEAEANQKVGAMKSEVFVPRNERDRREFERGKALEAKRKRWKGDDMKMPKTWDERLLWLVWRIVAGPWRWAWRHKFAALLLLGILYAVYFAGKGDSDRPAAVVGQAEAIAASQPAALRPRIIVSGITAKGVVINGRLVKIGEEVEGCELVGTSIRKRSAVWKMGDGVGFVTDLGVERVRPVFSSSIRRRFTGSSGGGKAPSAGS